MAQNDTQTIAIPGPGNFQFSGVKIEDLGAAEYTLATMVVDISGSVSPFKHQLLDCIKAVVAACRKHPRAENLLFRLLLFNSTVVEVHGFLNLSDIDPDKYDELDPDGMTALFDAYYDGVSATVEFGKMLIAQDFDVNGIVIGVTDGMNNRGKMTPGEIKKKCQDSLAKEEIESLITILIGLHDPQLNWAPEVQRSLSEFHVEGDLTQFIDIGDATPENLAKLGNFVSESISSQSNALGTGAPSQTLNF
jgi:hypothetical protein